MYHWWWARWNGETIRIGVSITATGASSGIVTALLFDPAGKSIGAYHVASEQHQSAELPFPAIKP
jgi:hypothetical protein